jgi:hypothetical protein
MFKKSVILSAASLLLAGTAHAVPLTYGAYTDGGLWGGDASDGGFGTTSAYVGGTSTQLDSGAPAGSFSGTYQAQATFDGTSYLPVLRAKSSMTAANAADPYYSGEAYALQTFTYTGASTTLTLNLSMHGVVTDDPTQVSNPYIRGKAYVFGGTLDVVPLSTGNYCNNGIFSQGFQSYICGSDLGSTSATNGLWISAGDQTVTDSISFNVNNGDTFMIYNSLTALSFAGSADAWNTFTMSVDGVGTGSLRAASPSVSTVPLPMASWLFISGLLGMLGFARKK